MKSSYTSCFDNSEQMRVVQILVGILIIVALQWMLSALKLELPQKTSSSLMSMISDDTRKVISMSLMNKVDSYFHGGVKVDHCAVDDDADHFMHDGDAHHDQVLSDGAHDHHDHHAVALTLVNPVKWINSKIHAQEHRHLADDRSVELLPWVVAATRASPHNIQSYQIGSYILNRMVEKEQLAIDFLQEGIKNNPDSFILEVSLAEIFYRMDDKQRAKESFERALVKCQAYKKKLSDDDIFEAMKIYFYLGLIAKENNDINRLQELLQMAYEIDTHSAVIRSLEKWQSELENK